MGWRKMTQNLEIIGQDYNCETGETTPIYWSQEWQDQQDAIAAEQSQIQAAAQAEADAKAAAKSSAQAKLKALGLSDEESAAILG